MEVTDGSRRTDTIGGGDVRYHNDTSERVSFRGGTRWHADVVLVRASRSSADEYPR